MQSITYKFNTQSTQFNPAWLAIMSLWILCDIEESAKKKRKLTQRAIRQNAEFYRRKTIQPRMC